MNQTPAAHSKPFIPLLGLAGLLLLVFAWPIARKLLMPQYAQPIYQLNLILWLLAVPAVIAFFAYCQATTRQILRRFFVLSVFAVSTFPRQPQQFFGNISAETLSLIALALLANDLIAWRESHVYFARFAAMTAKHRSVKPQLLRWCCFMLFTSLAVATSFYCFDGFPSYTDSSAQYVHGKFIAEGKLYGESHPLSQFFPVWMMVNDGRWYSQYQPLQPFLIGIGHFFHAPWLVNPLAGAGSVLLIYAIAKRLYGEATGRVALLLAMTSPFIWIVSSEYMNHITAEFFALLFVYCYLVMHDAALASDRRWWALGAGMSLGMVLLLRPVTALCLAIPFALYSLKLLWRSYSRYFTPLYLMAIATLLCLLLNFWTNYEMAGDMLMFPSSRYHRGSTLEALGFQNGLQFAFWPLTKKIHEEWWLMNIALYDWSLPATFFVAFLFLWKVKNQFSRLLMWVVISMALGEYLNQFRNLIFGPRYIFETAGPLIILTAAGLRRVVAMLKATGWVPNRQAAVGMVSMVVIILISGHLIFRLPGNLQRYANDYMDSHKRYYHSMMNQSSKPALIFVGRDPNPAPKRNKSDPDTNVLRHRWISFTNPPRDDSDVIFAIDLGDKRNQKLMDYYPNRFVYVEQKGRLLFQRRPLSLPAASPP